MPMPWVYENSVVREYRSEQRFWLVIAVAAAAVALFLALRICFALPSSTGEFESSTQRDSISVPSASSEEL